MGEYVRKGYKLSQSGQEVQDILDAVATNTASIAALKGSQTLTVTITAGDDGGYTADKTYDEMDEALAAGRRLVFDVDGVIVPYVRREAVSGPVLVGKGSTFYNYLYGAAIQNETERSVTVRNYNGTTTVTYTETALVAAKAGKGLSSNDYTDGEKKKLNSQEGWEYYEGETYGECYNRSAPSGDYSVQIGESGFTVDSDVPDGQPITLLIVNDSGMTFRGSHVLNDADAVPRYVSDGETKIITV